MLPQNTDVKGALNFVYLILSTSIFSCWGSLPSRSGNTSDQGKPSVWESCALEDRSHTGYVSCRGSGWSRLPTRSGAGAIRVGWLPGRTPGGELSSGLQIRRGAAGTAFRSLTGSCCWLLCRSYLHLPSPVFAAALLIPGDLCAGGATSGLESNSVQQDRTGRLKYLMLRWFTSCELRDTVASARRIDVFHIILNSSREPVRTQAPHLHAEAGCFVVFGCPVTSRKMPHTALRPWVTGPSTCMQ